ncbi:MAG: iron chelate uptake ABC transporter family permease subunit [Phycisphaerae bacterium]|nr:iron chelate uptake ABC transporter family permease subunit [Phycisphaerae bacterium]
MIAAARLDWPSLISLLALRDYNTRVVVLGVGAFALASGVVGTFLMLRKRALLADVISHATLPGIALAFLVGSALGMAGKSLPVLLAGATITGVLAVLFVLAVVHTTRVKEDAALGIALSVFFGGGIALSSLVQQSATASAAGLDAFIYGKTAAMIVSDAWLIAGGAAIVIALCIGFFKELRLLCFDPAYAAAQGRPIVAFDLMLMGAVVLITVIGLQAVGLILVIALLVVPPAAARFWSDDLRRVVLISAGVGLISGVVGAGLSALIPKAPSGALIVLVSGALFIFSLVFGAKRGSVWRWLEARQLGRRVAEQHFLRSCYELVEDDPNRSFSEGALAANRVWNAEELARMMQVGLASRWIEPAGSSQFRLTQAGLESARRVTRNHRLWEMYLITHADIAPSHVDRDADLVEHVLDAEMITKLEALLAADAAALVTPPSPHRLPSVLPTGAAP